MNKRKETPSLLIAIADATGSGTSTFPNVTEQVLRNVAAKPQAGRTVSVTLSWYGNLETLLTTHGFFRIIPLALRSSIAFIKTFALDKGHLRHSKGQSVSDGIFEINSS